MDTINMLKTILETSNWSQEQLAGKLGVSFATVNSWINGKSQPREGMLKKIQDLYLAREIEYDGDPVYITLVKLSSGVKVGDILILEKDDLSDYDDESIIAWPATIDKELEAEYGFIDAAFVANSVSTVARGTYSAGRIYDRFNRRAKARVEFIFHGHAIARMIDWGVE